MQEHIKDIKNIGTDEYNKYFKISGYVRNIFHDEKIMYLSCPTCRKKVVEHSNSKWKCENCDKVYDTNIPTYMLSAVISDVSGNILVQFPRELGDQIMNGMSAAEFKELRESSSDQKSWLEHIKSNCEFKHHSILIKIRQNSY